MQRDLVFLLDILQGAEMIQMFVRGMDKAAFDDDVKTQDAVIRRIEVIGEAVRRLSMGFRAAHPDIP